MILAAFYGHIGEESQAVVPHVTTYLSQAFCSIMIECRGANNMAIHLTRDQAEAIRDGLSRELEAKPVTTLLPVSMEPAPALLDVDDDVPF